MRRSVIVNALFDVLVLTALFFIMIWIKPATKRVYLPTYIEPFLIFLGMWLVVSLLTKKYSAPERYSLSRAIFYVLFINSFILALATLLMFITQWMSFSRLVVFGTIFFTTLIELFFTYCDYYICNTRAGEDTSRVFEVYQRAVGRPSAPPVKDTFKLDVTLDTVPQDIKDAIIEESNPDVYQYLAQNINFNVPNYTLLSTTTRFNVEKLPEKLYLKIVNLKRINDIRFVNKFFESVNRKIPKGGIYIGCVETKNQRKARILRKYPPILNWIYYFFDYIIKRVFPKFNLTKRMYFFLTRGNNRVISKAETLGRLFSCGFDIIETKQIHGLLYFVTRKERDPYYDMSPTYGPFIKLKRIGKNKKIIYVYKLRTMHPYAEYIQQYVYEQQQLQEGGKFKNDFRVTTVGRFFRKFWIDELPMIINFLRGDLKIVGVRPLSEHYFNLYSTELQELRIKTKPGLIPPFYVDMPKTLDEIQESEFKYIRSYLKKPFRTDWVYFWKAIYNILFKKARSR